LVSGERIYLVLCSCFAVSEMKRWNFQNFELQSQDFRHYQLMAAGKTRKPL